MHPPIGFAGFGGSLAVYVRGSIRRLTKRVRDDSNDIYLQQFPLSDTQKHRGDCRNAVAHGNIHYRSRWDRFRFPTKHYPYNFYSYYFGVRFSLWSRCMANSLECFLPFDWLYTIRYPIEENAPDIFFRRIFQIYYMFNRHTKEQLKSARLMCMSTSYRILYLEFFKLNLSMNTTLMATGTCSSIGAA